MPTDLLSRARLKSLLTGAKSKRIVVLGDAMLDIYLRGDIERISPEAPVPVVRVRERTLALGGAANVAQNVAAAGCRVDLVAAVGKDAPAQELRARLRDLGADSAGLVELDKRATTTKTRIVARHQQVLRFDDERDDDLSAGELKRVAAALKTALSSADALIIEDYNKGLLTTSFIERAMSMAAEHEVPVVVDPKYKNFFAYEGATIFKPNRRELESALGAAVDVDSKGALVAARDRLKVKALLLTLSERGMALTVKGSPKVQRIPTTAREVFDVVGAGDTVTAYLAAMLAAGANPLEASVVANFAAGVEVGKSGAATVTANEVLAAYDNHGSN